MNFFDFFNADKSKIAMLVDENKRLTHEIANLRQKEIMSAGGMSEAKLTRVLRKVLAEELSRQNLEISDAYQVTGNSDGAARLAMLLAKPEPNKGAAEIPVSNSLVDNRARHNMFGSDRSRRPSFTAGTAFVDPLPTPPKES